ncbi:GNAT family N-acetyltransferase [Jonesiaceae bacterium BS-20]|uniref:GNAT family N-acetyltransferase n=1 Tax=Jonesiaceae bacterium BS-20 TaxID=3120821 RepID=A0AAU7DQN7_9MICO
MVEELEQIKIRPATPADAATIAQIHVDSWRQAYARYVPQTYLDSIEVSERQKMWSDVLAQPSTKVFMAETAGRALGFASVGPAKDEDAEPGDLTLYTMYLNQESWGLGVARRLMKHVDNLITEDVEMTLWVFAENTRARKFYERNGFKHDGVERLESFSGEYLTEMRYRK